MSAWYGTSTGASFCFIAGHEVPFPQSTLDTLYPNHGVYVREVRADLKSLQQERFITPDDARLLFRKAARSDIP